VSEVKDNPTPALPLPGEGADRASTKNLSSEKFFTQTPMQLKQGVNSSPCQGGGWEGVAFEKSTPLKQGVNSSPCQEKGRGAVKVFNEPTKTPLRRTLRKNPTEPERQLWNKIRNKQILDIKFRRQQGISRYIVDFYCAEYSLVIELDGDSHFTHEGIVYDRIRDEYLKTLGLVILRFTNSEVMQNMDGVLTAIINEIQKTQKIHGRND